MPYRATRVLTRSGGAGGHYESPRAAPFLGPSGADPFAHACAGPGMMPPHSCYNREKVFSQASPEIF